MTNDSSSLVTNLSLYHISCLHNNSDTLHKDKMFVGTVLTFLPVIAQSYVLDVENSDSLVITVDPEPGLVEQYYESL